MNLTEQDLAKTHLQKRYLSEVQETYLHKTGGKNLTLKEQYKLEQMSNMNEYIGVKVVKATPAWKCEWKSGKAGVLIEGPKGREENVFVASATKAEFGYKVVYEDGYESWSPKEVFDKAYLDLAIDEFHFLDDAELPFYQKSVIKERDAMAKKMTSLENFTKGAKFPTLSESEIKLIELQLTTMAAYRNALNQRINNFKVNKTNKFALESVK